MAEDGIRSGTVGRGSPTLPESGQGPLPASGHGPVTAVLLLVAASAAWGSTFVIMKHAVAGAPVPEFLAWRFLAAAAILTLLRPRALVGLGWKGWVRGGCLGVVLAAGYLAQTYGLEQTPAAVSGFLTGLQVVFTPLLGWILLSRRPGRRTWLASLLAMSGLAAISLRGVAMGTGELLTVASAALFALQIIGLDRWAGRRNAYGLAAVQLLVVGVVCSAVQSPSGLQAPGTAAEWAAVAVTAVAATAFAFVVQGWAQARLSATTTSVVLALEPVFGAVFAWASGEPLGWSVGAGGLLVVAAMLFLGTGPAPVRRGGERRWSYATRA